MPNVIILDPSSIISNFYTVKINHSAYNTDINMQIHIPMVNTIDLPATFKLLKRFLPSILRCQCFNDLGLPFMEEVCHTELGHLFEHILLEYLCMLKLARGYRRAAYSGSTDWNWVQEKRGTFHIHIDAGRRSSDIFDEALEKTKELFALILRSGQQHKVPILNLMQRADAATPQQYS